MKYAFMSFSCPQLSLDEVLALAAKYGYDGIEPRLDAKHGHGIEVDASAEARREVRRKVEDSPVALACLATSCMYADPRGAKARVEETLRCVDLAADVGAPRLRVFGGKVPEGVGRERATDSLANCLQQVAPHAQERGVRVCIETHDDWSHPAHLAEVMRRVNHPAIAINWDLMHPVRQGGLTMDQAFEIVRPWLGHVHFHDGLKRLDKLVMVPVGHGELDHRRAVQLLLGMGYDGYLSGEWINWEPYEVHLPRELAVMKAYEREA